MTRVKTCGLNTAESVAAAVEAGADYLGFIHYSLSPRHLSLDETAALIHDLPAGTKTVQVVVNPDDALVHALAAEQLPGFIQLHGSETPQRVADIAGMAKKLIIKAISVRNQDDVAAARAYLPHVHALLFDAKPPKDGDWLPGGNGLSFDWEILDQPWLRQQRWLLSGGLDVQNVAQAIQLTRAPGVDVSSGLETAPGEKDLKKIRAFLQAAKGSDTGRHYGT
ncbi:MAG: phosphoribosylanthranilate isomerase [Pseudomonadota bacterium]